jgi:hypothetical protein
LNRFLLDTNVISEMRKRKPHGAVVAWLSSLDADQVLICAVSLGKMQRGVERARGSDPKVASELETWLDKIASLYNVLPMDGAAFREWARLMERRSVTLSEDAMIAAIAREHGLTVATRDEADFAALGAAFYNPFKTYPSSV